MTVVLDDESEALVNTTTAGGQYGSAVTALKGGYYIVTWTASDGSSAGIYSQMYDADGNAVGSESWVNTETFHDQAAPAITALDDGGYVIVWQSLGQDGDGNGVYLQRFDDQGAAVGFETLVNTTTASQQVLPTVAGLDDGGYIVTWASFGQDGSGWGIYAQRYDDEGVAQGGETQINTYHIDKQTVPVVTALLDGGYVIAWQSTAEDGSGNGIYAQQYDADGNVVGGETHVSNETADDQSRPVVASLSDGGYVVTWMSHGQDGDDWGIYAQQYDASGSVVGTEQHVSTTTAGAEEQPSVTGLADGGYVIVWQAPDPAGHAIYSQRYDAAGDTVGSEAAVLSDGHDQFDVSIAGTADGGYVVTWTTDDGSGGGIQSVRYGVTGTLDQTGDGDANTLDGTGVDAHMAGLGGNDVYIVDSHSDVVVEADGEGTDEVQTHLDDYTLTNNVENLTLLSGALEGHGNSLDNIITGNSDDNVLHGYAGEDTLDGGTGGDTMIGGTGDDIYVVDNVSDTIVEHAGEGYDLVESSISYILGANVDDLTLTGNNNDSGEGNALDNFLTGDASDNSLYGDDGDDYIYGGGGTDDLYGGDGDDTYVVDDATTTIHENAHEGIDGVIALVTYTLSANIEDLQMDTSSSDNNDATGNARSNIMAGNLGDNSIWGLGGDDVLTGLFGHDTLYGGIGDDLYVVYDADAVIVENDGEGDFDTVDSFVTYTLSDHVEDLALDGSDNIDGTGNSGDNYISDNFGDNVMSGGDGNDTLDSLYGTDTLIGGLGDDTYYLADATTIVQENAGEGTDWEGADFSFTLADNVENLFLWDNAGDIDGTGNSGDNILEGNEGDNVLTGGGGNDTVNYDFESDRVLANLQTGIATGTSIGTDTLVDIANLTGSRANDLLVGDGNANILDGWWGDDQLQGGDGDDIYIVDSYHDIVREQTGEGTDTVMAEVDYRLSANVENLTLTLSALLGTGNDLNNYLTGNDNNNELHGKDGNDTLDGGTGGDKMYGEAGDDTYIVDDSGDVASELSHAVDAGGTDTVEASVSYRLGSYIENLVLTGTSGLSGWGNSAANSLTGNSGNNVLHGGGGNDTLDGGGGTNTLYGEAGDDTYVVDNSTTKVSEYQHGVDAGGSDTVEASVNFALGKFVENLTLTGTAISGTGNGLANVIIGNSEDNIIDGHGGSDTLTGGLGADTFVFGLRSGADVISDFSDTDGDTIDVTAYHLSAQPVITYVGGDAVITLSASNTITIQNATPAGPDIASHIVW